MLLTAVMAVTLSVTGAAAPASASDASVADRIFTLLNQERAKAGLAPLQRVVELDSVAQAWSENQARVGRMSHNPDYSRQYPAGWRLAAENVAYASQSIATGDKFNSMWMNSQGHRENMLRPGLTHVGIGVATRNGLTFATQNFAQYPSSTVLTPTSPSVASSTVDRWSGADRYAVSAEVSERNFAPGVGVAYIANGLTSADALSGAPVAAADKAPVLLTHVGSLPGEVANELARLRPAKIVILGGTGSVSSAVQNKLGAYTSGPVERWAGGDRFETSAVISRANYPKPGVDVAYVANGLTSVDALSAAPVAGMQDAPVLLTRPDSLPGAVAAELDRLDPKKIVILGGTGAVSPGVQRQLDRYTASTTRWSGTDRYAVSVTVSRAAFPNGAGVVYVANGLTSADALSAAPVAGKNRAPVLLTQAGSMPAAVQAELKRLDPDRVVVLGGTGAVSATVQNQVASITR
ncbi:cell wall-binding repeat-containing protein [Georgenia soli]|uniref:cell wall-binding repeat-containing protein n=1 Tax=Georgenia soli TaxID=638953 RepID=UPI001474A0E9|nr:cell wall-binding repeat-containing protein [Georgenia soli]